MLRAKTAVLVSGGGTNLQALLDAQNSGVIKSAEITLVISNNAGAYALTRAEKAGVKSMCISKKELKTQEAFEDAIINALEENGIDLIVLAGFMSILSERFTSRYDHRILNIHPSLIPSFCGQGYYGLKVTGATVHYVNEIPDGGEIIAQKAVYVEDGDTPETLQKRVMEQAEWIILPQSVEKIAKQIINS